MSRTGVARDRTPFITRLESRLTLRPHHSALIQPPLIAQAAERVSEITGDPEFLVRAYPKLAATIDGSQKTAARTEMA